MFEMATEQHPISLPPYPQMIMAAIEASNNNANGCNKTAIAKHIETTQSILPPSHSTLLNYHLNQMKQSGQIVMVKNNYMKPDPHAPPKRGRGRPPKPKPKPKPKPQGDSSHVAIPAPPVSPPRTRGRPPKVNDSSSEAKSKVSPSVSGRPRGRPPKKAKTESEKVKEATSQPSNGERRGRGRPPKVKPVVMVPVA